MVPTGLERTRDIASCLELAILLESSVHKPGNVSVVTNFEDTRYEHFLASAVAVRPSFELAAERGIVLSKGEIIPSQVGVGEIIKDGVQRIYKWQLGGNTLLGTVILLSPIAVAAGMSRHEEGRLDILDLRRNLKDIVESTTSDDAINLYEAIRTAMPNGLGKVSDLDVNSLDSTRRILDEGITLHQIFKIASTYDTICSEWVNNYPVTFDLAYPYLAEQTRKSKDTSQAVIQTFLKVLAEHPDTFIARKTSLERAKEVSTKAKRILELGALETDSGQESLEKFDKELRLEGNILNPGTTADLIAAALALYILSGYRP